MPEYIKFGVSIAFLLLFSAFGYHAGKVSATNKYLKLENEYKIKIIAQDKLIADNQFKLQEQISQTELARQQKQVVIQTKYKTITREVIKYVQTNPTDDVSVPIDWVYFHDAATNDSYVPTDANIARVNDTAATIKLSSIFSAVVDNYTTCNMEIQKLKGLQDEVKQNMLIINKGK